MERDTHWQEWREAVQRTGYNSALYQASVAMLALDTMSPQEVEQLFKERQMAETNTEALLVVCPKCQAARGAKCTKKVFAGMQFTDEIHTERISTYQALQKNPSKPTVDRDYFCQ